MKNTILTLLLAVASLYTSGQDLSKQVKQIEDMVRAEKRQILSENMLLNTGEEVVFWEIYQEYENKLKKITSGRDVLLKDYIDLYNNFDKEKAVSIQNRINKMEIADIKLRNKYYKKIAKAISPESAFRFVMIEKYLQSMVRFGALNQIPFVGDEKLAPEMYFN